MRIYLMRHGEASSPGGTAEPELTPHGVRQVAQAAEDAARRGVEVAQVIHSGKLRARQTAEIVASRLGPRAGVAMIEGFAPADDPFVAAGFVESLDESVLIVSHLPLLDRLAGLLVTGDPERVLVGFSTAQLVCLEGGEGEWEIV